MHSTTVEGVPTAPTGSQEDRPATPHPSMTWASTAPGLVQGEPDRNLQRVHASFIQDPYDREDVYRDITMHLCNSLTALECYTDCVAVTFTAQANFTGGTPINPSDIDIFIHMPRITLRSESMHDAFQEMLDIFRYRMAYPAVLERAAQGEPLPDSGPQVPSSVIALQQSNPRENPLDTPYDPPKSPTPQISTPPISPTTVAPSVMKPAASPPETKPPPEN
ncbi:hypothetical protein JB92DRAFT_783447 [Gautieria morchelliformis]|nr:hypothetical protein JB92DRAFT_783447 [Gautieria morchelliformis]